MSVDVKVVPPSGCPNVKEPICSFARTEGKANVMMAPELLGKKRLDDESQSDADRIETLKRLIAEIDKDNEGIFTDAWALATVPCAERMGAKVGGSGNGWKSWLGLKQTNK